MFYLFLSAILAFAAGSSGYVATRNENPDETRNAAKLTGGLSFVAWVLLTGAFSITTVPTGAVGVRSTFGRVNLAPNSVAHSGVVFKSPITNLTLMSVQQGQIMRNKDPNKGTDGGAATFYTADNVKLDSDLAVAYALNPTYAPRVLQGVGQNFRPVIINALSSALRTAGGKFKFNETMTTQRSRLEESIAAEISASVVQQLAVLPAFSGLSKSELASVFSIAKVNLGDTLPSKEIQDSINRRQAAEQDLQQQEALLKIARKKAEILGKDGAAVRNFLAGVNGEDPSTFEGAISTTEAVAIMHGIAAMRDSNARVTAAEKGNVPFVLSSGATVTVPAPTASAAPGK
jgi:regulator of protease activity HflC (stomatin/prohibitin superfamily)